MSSFYRYLDHDCIDTTFGRLIMSAKNLFNSKDLVDFYKNYILFEQFPKLQKFASRILSLCLPFRLLLVAIA